MISIDIPGYGLLEIEHLVLDYNGTLAEDGRLIPGVAERIEKLSAGLKVHVVTADTFGSVAREFEGLPCEVHILPPGQEAEAKAAFVRGLGAGRCAALGNGANDELMLAAARLGIAVIGPEGAARVAALAAAVLVTDPLRALDLLLNPLRLKATLRT